jgi:putative hydrolase of HD superfamily
MQNKNLVNYIFEIGQLKRLKRSGFTLSGINQADSVAEHSHRAAIIGYILAEMEGANAEKVASMLLIHDLAECRVMDQHKVAARYQNNKQAEIIAFNEQLESLPPSIAKKFLRYFTETNERQSKEGIIAKDADWLELAFQAKEYVDIGYKSAVDLINNVEQLLETKSAKNLIADMKKTQFTDWWQGLKKMTYTKLIKK